MDTDDQQVLDGLIQRLAGETQPNGAEGDEGDEENGKPEDGGNEGNDEAE
jgi:hypothetical protein